MLHRKFELNPIKNRFLQIIKVAPKAMKKLYEVMKLIVIACELMKHVVQLT